MTQASVAQPGAGAAQAYSSGYGGGGGSANLGDILERVLDKGLVIAGDIQVNLLDIELLTIKLRLVIASLDTAREVGINWWENDPWLNANASRRQDDSHELEEENRQLREQVRELESGQKGRGNSRSGQKGRGNSRSGRESRGTARHMDLRGHRAG